MQKSRKGSYSIRVSIGLVAALGMLVSLPGVASADAKPTSDRQLVPAQADEIKSGAKPPANPAAPRSNRSATTGSSAARAGGTTPAISGPFRALQMNLCNGGEADCFTNTAIGGGNVAMTGTQPDLVTLNEICLRDVQGPLSTRFGGLWPNDWVVWVFVPAMIRGTENPYRCVNGDPFGNAVMARMPDPDYFGYVSYGWRYGTQDGGQEERTAACVYMVLNYYACSTHLSANSEPVALTQCRTLMTVAVPAMISEQGISNPVVVGGDLNLEYDTSDPENVQNCVPAGYTRKGDGSVQHIMASNSAPFGGTGTIRVEGTDHPGFYGDLVMP